MRWNFLGFHNWLPHSGDLDLFQSADVFRASLSSELPRDMCEGCVCWSELGTCTQVQVEDWEEDKAQLKRYLESNVYHIALPETYHGKKIVIEAK